MHGGKPDHTRPLVAFFVLVLVTAVTLGASLARSNADLIAAGNGPGPDALLRPAGTFPVVPGTGDARPTAAPSSTVDWVPAGFGVVTPAAPETRPGRSWGRGPKTTPAAATSAPGHGVRAGNPAARNGAASPSRVAAGTSGKATVRLQDADQPDHGDNPRRARLSATAVRVALVRLAG